MLGDGSLCHSESEILKKTALRLYVIFGKKGYNWHEVFVEP